MAASGYSEHDDWLFPIFRRTVTDLSLGFKCQRWHNQVVSRTLKTRRLALHLLRSISGLLAHLFFYVAIVYVPLVDANLLLSAAPLWVPLLLLVFLRQTVTRELWISTLVGLVGVGLILHPHHRP